MVPASTAGTNRLWQYQVDPFGFLHPKTPTTEILLGICFSDVNTGTAVSFSGTILRTTDGGDTWLTQISRTANTLRAVSFSDANNGTAVGDGDTILRKTTSAPAVSLDPDAIDFGDVEVGATSMPQTVTLATLTWNWRFWR
jgi:hypothetical protein